MIRVASARSCLFTNPQVFTPPLAHRFAHQVGVVREDMADES